MALRRFGRRLLCVPLIGRALAVALRVRVVVGFLLQPIGQAVVWLLRSNELTNFTYRLEARNELHLAAIVSEVTGSSFDEVSGFMRELASDEALRQHIAARTRGRLADPEPLYGRRSGWYAVVRALKPRVVVETGVDKGLGSCVLAAALSRNAEEGRPGRYVGLDIDPGAGYLLAGAYSEFGEIRYGDSLLSLERFEGTIDLFVNDSDHSAGYEAEEYAAISGKLSPGALILGDNAHCTDALFEFSRATGRQFLFFAEKPLSHWYPGGGIGFAFRRRTQG